MQATVRKGKRDGFSEVVFPQKAADEIRSELKSAGYRFNSRDDCWWGPTSSLPARYAAGGAEVPAAEPEPGKVYALTGKAGDPCIANGNTLAESEVPPAAPVVESPAVTELSPAQRYDPAHPGSFLMSFQGGEDRVVQTEEVSSSGLALVRPTRKRAWSILHLPSGRALGAPFTDVSDLTLAQTLFALAQSLADWNQPAETLLKNDDLKARLKELPARAKCVLALKAQAPAQKEPEPAPAPEPVPPVKQEDPEVSARARLEADFGQVWNTDELRRDFEVISFCYGACTVRELSTGLEGTLHFDHHPRFYYNFVANPGQTPRPVIQAPEPSVAKTQAIEPEPEPVPAPALVVKESSTPVPTPAPAKVVQGNFNKNRTLLQQAQRIQQLLAARAATKGR